MVHASPRCTLLLQLLQDGGELLLAEACVCGVLGSGCVRQRLLCDALLM
jgi:hypothetical protein